MSDESKKLQLKIELDGYVMPGAEEAQQQLAKANTKLAKEMGVVTVTAGDVEKALAKGGETAEMSHLSMRRLAHAMGSEIPGGAALLESAFTSSESAMMSSTFLLIAGVEMLRSAIAKINKEKDESRRLSDALADADKSTTKVVDAQRDALDKAEVSEAEFFHNFERNARTTVDAVEKLASATSKIVFANAGSQDSARKSIVEKEIDDLEHRGFLKHEEAVRAKEMIDLEYEARKLQRQEAQNKLDEASLQRQVENKTIALRNDLNAIPGAEQKYKTAAEAKAANDAKIEEAQRKIAAGEDSKKSLREAGVTEENIQRMKESYKKFSGKPSDGPGAVSLWEMFHYLNGHGAGIGLESMKVRNMFGTAGAANLALYESAETDAKSGKSDLARARKNRVTLDVNEGNAKSDLESTRSRAEKDRGSALDLVDTLHEKIISDVATERGARTDFGLAAAATAIQGHVNNINDFMGQVNRLAAAMANMTPTQMLALSQRVSQIEAQVAQQQRTGIGN